MNDADAPFASPKLLIARAKENFEDFEGRCNTFFTQKVGASFREHDTETGCELIKFRLKERVPDITRTVFSDGVRGGSRNCYFPVARDEIEFANIFEIKRYRKVPVDLRPFLAATKAYRGGDDLLWSLCKLTGPWDRRKHELVVFRFKPPGAKVTGDVQVPINVVLAPGDVVGGQPARAVADAFKRKVERIVEGIEAETRRLLAERNDSQRGSPDAA